MSTAPDSPPSESPPPESPPTESPAGARRPADGARSGAEDGWAVPGVTGSSARGRGHDRRSSRNRGRAGGRVRGGGRSEDVDPSEVLKAAQVEALAGVATAIEVLAEMAGSVSGVQALMVARQVHTLSNRLSGVHAQVLACAAAGQAWAGDGYLSAPRWLAESHLLSPRVARDRVADADWLTEYPMFAESLGAGRISAAHVTVVRRVTAATELRRAAFAQVAVYWVTVAQGRDPDTLAALLRAWAALVDDTEDDQAEKAWRNRALRVTHVGDEWVITGRLPAVEGARLSAVLNEIMDIDRRTRCSCDPADECVCPENDRTITQRRADALLAIVDAVTARPPSARRKAPEGQTQTQTDAGAGAQAEAQPGADIGADTGADPGADAQTQPAAGADAEAGSAAGSAAGTAEGTREAADVPAWSPTGPEPWGPPSSPPRSEPGAAPWSPPGSDSGSGSGSGTDPETWLGLAPGWNTGRLGDRTRVVLVIRAEDLNPPSGSPGPIPGPDTRPEDLMSTWSTSNGPGTGLLAHTTMLRELCDTTVQRLILGPDSQPLDIGRATRTIPAQLRTALHVRDRGCVFPACDRPPGWTEAHHLTPWATGGDTAIHNLALLCSQHHHLIHTGTWTIRMGTDGHPEVTKVWTYPRRN